MFANVLSILLQLLTLEEMGGKTILTRLHKSHRVLLRAQILGSGSKKLDIYLSPFPKHM